MPGFILVSVNDRLLRAEEFLNSPANVSRRNCRQLRLDGRATISMVQPLGKPASICNKGAWDIKLGWSGTRPETAYSDDYRLTRKLQAVKAVADVQVFPWLNRWINLLQSAVKAPGTLGLGRDQRLPGKTGHFEAEERIWLQGEAAVQAPSFRAQTHGQ